MPECVKKSVGMPECVVNDKNPESCYKFTNRAGHFYLLQVPREKLLDFVPFFKERAVHCHGKQGQQGILKAIEVVQ